jgi:hypothetical protein
MRTSLQSTRQSFLPTSEKESYPAHHFVKTGFIATCQVCDSNKLHVILDLVAPEVFTFSL